MNEREGVIQFHLNYEQIPCITVDQIADINGWRTILHRLSLIGQDSSRYQGLGFGNISVRAADNVGHFIITGSQTGAAANLDVSDYARVLSCDPYKNAITARGETRPSSEAMTHGQIYQLDSLVNSVVHTHSPDIWKNAEKLNISATPKKVRYGTPEMAQAVQQLFAESEMGDRKIFIMGGHEDGVVSFGNSVREACTVMITCLAAALIVGREET